jgi:hypothetical protein
MNTILKPRISGIFLSLLLLCSRATADSIHPQLPADVIINKNAGRGSLLFVTLRLESGEELPFVVDTGASGTCFDKSLEPKLGKPLDTATISMSGSEEESGIYVEPKLYLGSTPLMTGTNIVTHDFKWSTPSGRPVMGILGMDCLKHYCIQLDFEAGKMRFLDPDHVNTAGLGKAFPLSFSGWSDSSEGQSEREDIRPFIHFGSLIGGKGTNLLIDTGCIIDGLMKSRLYWREVSEQRGSLSLHFGRIARFPECVWDGETYTNLLIGKVPSQWPNMLGLRFLARHLVTFNFPKGMMYLKRTSIGTLVDEGMEAAMNFLTNLKEKGQLPGWSKDDKGTTYLETYSCFGPKSANGKGATYLETNSNSGLKSSVTFDVLKNGDSSIYHFTVTRASKDSPWKLQKAWRTDQNDHAIEKYPE